MDDDTLLKIALSCSLIGITVLFFISENIEIESEALNDINVNMIGENVVIKGRITKARDYEKVLILTVEDAKTKKTMPVIVFKDGKTKINENTDVEIIGEIREYNGKMELIADEIKAIY